MGRGDIRARLALSDEKTPLEGARGLGRAGFSCRSRCSMREEVGTAGAYASRKGGIAADRAVLSGGRVCRGFFRRGLIQLGKEGEGE